MHVYLCIIDLHVTASRIVKRIKWHKLNLLNGTFMLVIQVYSNNTHLVSFNCETYDSLSIFYLQIIKNYKLIKCSRSIYP